MNKDDIGYENTDRMDKILPKIINIILLLKLCKNRNISAGSFQYFVFSYVGAQNREEFKLEH